MKKQNNKKSGILYCNLNISIKLLDAVIIGGLLAIAFIIISSLVLA